MMRVRAAAFCTGFALASALAFYQMQKELRASHHTLHVQANGYHSDLEVRIARLEEINGVSPQSKLSHNKDD